MIAEQLKEFQKALAGARRANQLLQTIPAIPDGPLDATALGPGSADLRFEGVTLRYHRDDIPAVRDIDLVVPAGTRLGVIGRTGSGKTTLGRVVARLWVVDQGAIRISGIDVRELKTSALRSRVPVVTQDVGVFTASIRDNLTIFGSRSVPDEKLHEVLGRVGLEGWFALQSDWLGTWLDGARVLSAGEAQLLVSARAFPADPAIVILDEASSRLDPATEQRVSAALDELLEGRTVLIIAHRLETLDDVDHIAVMEDGRLVEHGERSTLADDPDSLYAHLLRAAEHGATLDEILP